jgi:hypothetical protein
MHGLRVIPAWGRAEVETARKRRINDAVKGVAFILGNTPAVCRASIARSSRERSSIRR